MMLPVNYFGHETLKTRSSQGAASKQSTSFASIYRQAVDNLSEDEVVPESGKATYRASEDADGRLQTELRWASGYGYETSVSEDIRESEPDSHEQNVLEMYKPLFRTV